MLRFIFSFVLVSAFAFLRIHDASAASVAGVHPYDQNRSAALEKLEALRVYRTMGYRGVQQFRSSKYHTTTHMLHPYFRSQPYTQYLHEDERKLHPYLSIRNRF